MPVFVIEPKLTAAENMLLKRAITTFGTQEAALEWMVRPARFFLGRRPVDVLHDSDGADQLTQFLIRLDHGIYM